MKPMIELNRLSIVLDKTALTAQQNAIILKEGNLPVLGIPFKLGLVDLHWLANEGQSCPEEFGAVFTGMVVDPNWKMHTKLDVFMTCAWKDKIARWGEVYPFELRNLYLGDESHFLVDSKEVNMTSTINKVLAPQGPLTRLFDYSRLNTYVEQLSLKYFGTSLLTDLLKELYYQVEGDFDIDEGKVTLSAAYDLKHFSQTDEAPPYLFLKFPTTNLEYVIDQFDVPEIEVKGYQLSVNSLKVRDDKVLEVNVNERSKGWTFNIGLNLVLDKNKIYPEVDYIHSEGLGLVSRTLFKILKGVLIRRIERKPIAVADVYRKFSEQLYIKYPFLQIQPGYIPFIDALSIDPEETEVMLHFEKSIPEDPI